VTVGAQIGGQAFSEVIFFETKEALEKFKKSEFAMSAQVSAVAAQDGASKNAKYVEGVMVFTKAKQGLMAEASVGGQKFKFEPAGK
jgi:lipid-binding SYLF domain-containing protein